MSERTPVVVEYTDESGSRYRVVYEPAENGAWERTVYRRRGCEWRPVGSEDVSDVTLS